MKKLSLIFAILILVLSTGCGGTKNGSIAEDGISGKDFISNFVDKSGIKLHTLSETTKDNQDIGTFADAKENYNIKVDYHEDTTTHKMSATSIVFKKDFDLDVFIAWATSVDNSFTDESAAQLYEDLVEKQKEESQKDGEHGIGTVKINGLKYMLNYFMEDAPRISVLKSDKKSEPVEYKESDSISSEMLIKEFCEKTSLDMKLLSKTPIDECTAYMYIGSLHGSELAIEITENTKTREIENSMIIFQQSFNENLLCQFMKISNRSLTSDKDALSLYNELLNDMNKYSNSNIGMIERNNFSYTLLKTDDYISVSISKQ